jgi:thiamine biosynthesis lipoprotein
VTQLKNTGEVVFPHNFIPLIAMYRKFYDLSKGLITPLIGNLLESAGYDKSYSLIPKDLKKTPEWDKALTIDKTHVKTTQSVILDFGAMGKGYLVDIIARHLEEMGIAKYCVDAGGDIYVNSKNPIIIGLENPLNFTEAVGEIEINNECICGSSGNRRKWGNYNHIINPKTFKSVDDILAVWSIAKSGILADALSTALFFIPAEKLESAFDFQYLILYPDFSIKKSKNFRGTMYHA